MDMLANPVKVAGFLRILQYLTNCQRNHPFSSAVGNWKKTRLANKTIRNILFRAGKQGKIKRAGRGVYLRV